MKTASAILAKIARIRFMERGKLCAMRTGPSGTYYNHQTWEKGHNVVRYVPPAQATGLRKAIEGYQRFLELTQAYADQIIRQTRRKDVRHTSPKKTKAKPAK